MGKPYAFILFSLFLMGCASNMRDQFEQVKVGMDKGEVLGLMDSPQRTQRWQGKDRWTYIFYDQNNRFEKEVDFAEGVASYVGDVRKPEISAEQRDAMNEASNKELEARYQSLRDENRKNFGSTEGLSPSDSSSHFVPEFKPVQ